MPLTNTWDDNTPLDTQAANQLGKNLRDLRVDTRERMSFQSGAEADKPNLEAGFVGKLYFATDTGKVWRWTGSAWNDVSASILTASAPNFGALLGIDNMVSFRKEDVNSGNAHGSYLIIKLESDAGARYFEFAFGLGDAEQGDTIPVPVGFTSGNAIANAGYKRSTVAGSPGDGLIDIHVILTGLVVTTCEADLTGTSTNQSVGKVWCAWTCFAWRFVEP